MAMSAIERTPLPQKRLEPLSGAYFWLSMFYLVYCVRPEDWIPGLRYLPLAKISAIFAFAGLALSLGRSKRGLRDLPQEAFYLLGMIGLLFVSAAFSPVWRGGALYRTLDFAKVFLAWVLTFLVITTIPRLRRIVFIQAASVAVVCLISIVKGHSRPRLEGVLGGIYSNPNDLAFAIVLSLPFCLAFLVRTKSIPRKVAWSLAILAMAGALFLTASRAGFITLLIVGPLCLWHFAVKGRRLHLIFATAAILLIAGVLAGGRLKDRFLAISGEDLDTHLQQSAYGSFEQRRLLILSSLKATAQHPFLGLGAGNFTSFSGTWREVHVSYLQIAVEGGIPVLILYLMFFRRGFVNLKRLRELGSANSEVVLFAGALHSSLLGFVFGALFAPEAYQYFPYFAVVYTAVLLAIVQEQQGGEIVARDSRSSRFNRHASNRKPTFADSLR